jgi:Peroxiredoxin
MVSIMRRPQLDKTVIFIRTVVVLCFAAFSIFAQPTTQATPTGKSIFFDSDGREVSNNEFVDIRMANFHIKDSTLMKVLPDGTVEFRLQKVPQEGMRIPDFAVQTLDGKAISAAGLKGKVLVLNFWFIGCPVCLAHKPGLNDLAGRFKGEDDVVFLAMTGDSVATVKKYLAKEQFDYLQAANVKSAMDLFTFTGYPKNIVVSRTGEIVYWRSTVKAWDKFESVIRAELEKQ